MPYKARAIFICLIYERSIKLQRAPDLLALDPHCSQDSGVPAPRDKSRSAAAPKREHEFLCPSASRNCLLEGVSSL